MCQVKLTFKQIEHPGILMIILNGCFAQIHSCKLHNCDIDLIASHFNVQLPCNASWKPDPGASFTDAFTISWAAYYFYAFPPFSIILHCLQKAEQEEAEGIPVVPNWLTKRHGTPNLCRWSKTTHDYCQCNRAFWPIRAGKEPVVHYGSAFIWWHSSYLNNHPKTGQFGRGSRHYP